MLVLNFKFNINKYKGTNSNMKLDHIFICTKEGAPEAELLKAFGLSEGSNNIHPGQGTANRRFFFHNVVLELLWLENPAEAQSELTNPTGLYERCSLVNKNISPFGFCFWPSDNTEKSAPFPAWKYSPTFFPKPLAVEIGKAPLEEPMWFFISFLTKPGPEDSKEPWNHDIGFKELTKVTVSIANTSGLSVPANKANSLDGFNVKQDSSHLMELEFDAGTRGEVHDFRPSLPLVLRW